MLEAFQTAILNVRSRGHWLWVEPDRLQDMAITENQAALIVARHFDKTCRSGETNTIVLDGAHGSDANFLLIDQLFDGLAPLIAGLPGRSLVKEGTGFAINRILMAPGLAELGELAREFTSDLLDEGVQILSNSTIETLLQPVTDQLGTQAIGAAESKVSDVLGDIAREGFDFVSYFRGRRLLLSPDAKDTLRNEFQLLRGDPPKTPSAGFQMVMRILLACSLGEGGRKVIVLKNPELLDTATFNVLRQLLLLARHALQNGEPLPISCVVLNSSRSVEGRGREWLQRLRLFTIRNSLHQTPLSNLRCPAIPESVFVGRDLELSRLSSEDSNVVWWNGRCVVSVISGESGNGKTKLALTYLERLKQRKDTAPPFVLTLACPPEIGSGEGSVQSLLSSLEENLDALLNERSLKAKATDYARDQVTAQQLAKRIIGVDLVEVGRSLVDLTMRQSLRKNLADRLEAAGGGVENQDAFDRILDEALRLHRRQHSIDSKTAVPVVLLIDDIHWITESTAGVVLKYLVASHPTRILVTKRPAEWNAKLDMALADPANHNHFLLLAALFGLTPVEDLPDGLLDDAAQLLRKIGVSASWIPINGISPEMLGRAISRVMRPVVSSEALSLSTAEAIVEFLGGKEDVNSLMAIETFNLLAEQGFSDRHGTWPLVSWEDDAPAWTKNCHAVALHSEVVTRLERLRELYSETYRDDSPLSLASYAIFEEKLALLTSHLDDTGPAARYFLYLAALAGSPFLRLPLERILKELATADNGRISPLALQRLRNALQWNDKINFEGCCRALETIFAILRQARALRSGYEFYHSLFLTFFSARLDEALQELCEDLSSEEARAFGLWFHKVCYKHFDVRTSHVDLQEEAIRTESLASAEAQVRVGRRLRSNYPSLETAIDAYNSLSVAVKLQTTFGDPSIALQHLVEMLDICDAHLTFEPPHDTITARLRVELGKYFKDLYRFDLARRALLPILDRCPESSDNMSYIILSAQMLADITADADASVRYLERAADLHSQHTGATSPEWAAIDPGSTIEQRIAIDNSKALAYRDAGDMSRYLEQTKLNLARMKQLLAEDHSEWLKTYTLHLNNYAEALRRNEMWTTADAVLDYALLILRSKFAEDGVIWAVDLVRAYHNKANSYKERRLGKQALTSLFQATLQVEPLLQKDQPFNPTLVETVAFVWGEIGSVAYELGDHDVELSARSTELSLLRALYTRAPQKVALILAKQLIHFSVRLIALVEARGEVRANLEVEQSACNMRERALKHLEEARGLVGAETHADDAFARTCYEALSYMVRLKTEKADWDHRLNLLKEIAELSLARTHIDQGFWPLAADEAINAIIETFEDAGRLQEAEAWRHRCKTFA